MSHTVTTKAVEVRNPQLLRETARQLGLACTDSYDKHKLFDGTQKSGYAVSLPGWREKVIFDTESGNAYYDNYRGSWGDQIELDKFINRYSCNMMEYQAAEAGYMYQEIGVLENGDVELALTEVVAS